MVTLGEARRASEIGQPMNIAVRMDCAWIGSIDFSIHKAFKRAQKQFRFSKGAIINGKQSWSGICRAGKS